MIAPVMILILIACALTVVIELAYFQLRGRDTFDEVLTVIFTNIFTNILMNIVLLDGGIYLDTLVLLVALELIVVLIEFIIYSLAFGFTWRLLLDSFLANLFSLFFGTALIFGLAFVISGIFF